MKNIHKYLEIARKFTHKTDPHNLLKKLMKERASGISSDNFR